MDCVICTHKVFVTERIDANGRPYHKTCFKCSEKGCRLTLVNFHSHEGRLYCQKHVPKLQAIISPLNRRRLVHSSSTSSSNLSSEGSTSSF
ncbi:predicted protein [Lichtheimia corymbifera JMRC:FSU:9682]|uniref:LIM zinc-binding domain-containing protein n=1 Tax=Lichtheimia corymbifera JMRC:FSU:9682 TaxID=1263082 RepID=A0A068REL8_9FUNG|nr:predicted protein [Lichtheimia corymbifera JMRC:FSU:9682]